MLFESIERIPSENIALINSDGSEITYGGLFALSNHLTQGLSERALAISVATSTSDFIIGYVGFIRSKIVQIIVPSNISESMLDNLVSRYKPNYLFVPENFKVNPTCNRVKNLNSYQLFQLTNQTSIPMHRDLALLLSTSGSTGSPKLVRISYENVSANTSAIIQYLGISQQDRAITTMPLSYSFGLSIINTHLHIGASIVVTESSVLTRDFWNLVKSNDVTSLSGVPYFFEMIKKLNFDKMHLPSLKILTQAGGKLDSKIGQEFLKVCLSKKIRFYIMYGQTEATARISYFCANDHPEKIGTIGNAIPGGRLWLIDDLGNRIEQANQIGELVFEGPNVSMGFANDIAELEAGDINKNVLLTGDLAKMDHEGFFTIVGRKKRFVKLFGLRLSLDEIEALMKNKGFDVYCVGDDSKLVLYTTDANENVVQSALIDLLKIPKNSARVIRLPMIPRTASGKVDYNALQMNSMKENS